MQTKFSETPGETALSVSRPFSFRLPKDSGPDPFFGLTRSFYYLGEQLGYWRLLRIRQHGKKRGIVMVPYGDVEEFIRAQNKGRTGRNYVDETELKIRAQNLREKDTAAAK